MNCESLSDKGCTTSGPRPSHCCHGLMSPRSSADSKPIRCLIMRRGSLEIFGRSWYVTFYAHGPWIPTIPSPLTSAQRDKIRRWMASHGEESEDLSDSATHPSKWPVIDRLEPRAALRWASGYAYLSIPLTFDKEQDVVLIKGANAKTEKCGPYTILATLKGVSFRIGSDFLLIPVVTLQRP